MLLKNTLQHATSGEIKENNSIKVSKEERTPPWSQKRIQKKKHEQTQCRITMQKDQRTQTNNIANCKKQLFV